MSDPIEILAKGMQDYPTLPEALPENARRAAGGKTMLADGCYFLAYGPAGEAPVFEGTLRVDSRSGRLSASGDLYEILDSGSDVIGLVPPPCPGIPIFPIASYAYYLRVTQIEATADGFTLVFEAHRHTTESFTTLDWGSNSDWLPQGSFTMRMTPAAAPPGYPKPELFFCGEVAREDGKTIGEIQIGWVSPLLRKATIEIDSVPESEIPLKNGAGLDWQTVFNGFGWDVLIVESNKDVTKKGGPIWNEQDARAAMATYRDSCDLNAEWRYYVLVGQFVFYQQAQQRGAMYDLGKREGLLLASHLEFPADEARWGPLRGVRAEASMLTFFRTAVHEMGHAMGLGHDDSGVSIMRPTDEIADEASADAPFPTNIRWAFAPDDEHRLRHWPDLIVRPGGAGYDEVQPAPVAGA